MSFVLAAMAGFLLCADLVGLAPPPALFPLVHPGLCGHLIQPLLVVAAILWQGRGRCRELGAVGLCVVLAVLLCPMVALDQAMVPLAHAWRWAGTGSPDGWFSALPASVVAAAAASALLLANVGNRSFRWLSVVERCSGWVLVALAALMPWLGVLAQSVLYGFGAGPRMLVSAVLQTAALGAGLWCMRRAVQASEQGSVWPDLVDQGWSAAALGVLPPLLLLAAYFVLKLETVSWSATDENIYFYDILLFTQGKMPYRDFFLAHPPLHIMLPGLLALLTSPSFLLLKLVPVVASMASGLFIYMACLRQGKLAGLLGAMFFLFAMEQLQASTNLTGINLTVMFLCASLFAIVSRKMMTGGILGGLGVLTGVYASVPALALLPVAATFGLGGALRYSGGLAATAGGGNLLFHALFGRPFLDQVYRYHFLKEAKVEGHLSPSALDLAGIAAAGLALVVGVLLYAEWQRTEGSFSKRSRTPRIAVLAACALVLVGVALGAGLVSDGPGSLALLAHDFGRFVEDKEFLRFFFFHPHLVLAPLVAMLSLLGWAAARRILSQGSMSKAGVHTGRTGGAGLCHAFSPAPDVILLASACCLAVGALAELSLLPESYTFYYVLLIPGLAVLLGCAGAWVLASAAALGAGAELPGRLREAVTAAATTTAAATVEGRVLRAAGILIVAAAALSHFAWVPVGLAVGDSRFPHAPAGITPAHRAQLKPGMEVAGDLTCYDVKDNVVTPFSSIIRKRFLPACRFQGSMESGVFHYLWKKKWYFSRAGELAGFIRDSSDDGETITGSSLLAPLLAMLSGRPLAADFVDTNTKRFKAGMVEQTVVEERCRSFAGEERERCIRIEAEHRFWRQVCRTRLRFIIAGPDSFFTPQRMMRHPLVRRFFRPEMLANEPHLNMSGRYSIVLFRRISEVPQADGSWCSMEAPSD